MVTTVTSDYRYHDYHCNKWLSFPWPLYKWFVTMITAVTSDYRYHDYTVTSDYRFHDYHCNKWLSLPWLQL